MHFIYSVWKISFNDCLVNFIVILFFNAIVTENIKCISLIDI